MDFLPDIEQFVRSRFNAEHHPQVTELLRCPAVSTPRVMRSVLYLANGSITMLQHYVKEAEKDVRMIVVEAEYVTEVSAEPLYMRDMSLPFMESGNLGPKACGQRAVRKTPTCTTGPTARADSQGAAHHEEIWGRVFHLGDVEYTVLEDQPSRAYVNCQRSLGGHSSKVRLPLLFVFEQLAETVEITPVGFTTV